MSDFEVHRNVFIEEACIFVTGNTDDWRWVDAVTVPQANINTMSPHSFSETSSPTKIIERHNGRLRSISVAREAYIVYASYGFSHLELTKSLRSPPT